MLRAFIPDMQCYCFDAFFRHHHHHHDLRRCIAARDQSGTHARRTSGRKNQNILQLIGHQSSVDLRASVGSAVHRESGSFYGAWLPQRSAFQSSYRAL